MVSKGLGVPRVFTARGGRPASEWRCRSRRLQKAGPGGARHGDGEAEVVERCRKVKELEQPDLWLLGLLWR